jgi:hypothetical protein
MVAGEKVIVNDNDNDDDNDDDRDTQPDTPDEKEKKLAEL